MTAETMDSSRSPEPPAWAAEHLELLVELRNMGMALARDLMRKVSADAEAAEKQAGPEEAPRRGAAPADPGLTFAWISRAVRLTIAFEAQTHRMIEGAGAANDDAPDAGPQGPIDYAGIRRRFQAQMYGREDYEIAGRSKRPSRRLTTMRTRWSG